MFIALYARQSIDKDNSLSIETQLSLCRALIKESEKSTQVREFFDKGYSGKNTNRPSFQNLMNEVTKGNVKKIIVYKLDRISRSLIDFANMLQTFKKHSVEFQSSNESFDTQSPYGEMIMKILMVFAEFERQSIAGRVKDSYIKRSSLGLYTGGKKVFGFDMTPYVINGIETKKYAINNNEKQIVEHIFTQYSYPCTSLRSLQSTLQKENIKDNNGSFFSASRLSSILRNPIYAKADNKIYSYLVKKGAEITENSLEFDGSHHIMLYGKTDNQKNTLRAVLLCGEGMIESDLWLTCQEKLLKNKKFGSSVSNKKSFLSGKLSCSKCLRTMTTIKGTSATYFFCTGKTHKKTCSGIDTTLYVYDIENAILQCIEERLSDTSFSPSVNQNTTFEKQLYSKLLKAEQKKTALIRAVTNFDFSSDACELLNAEAQKIKNEQETIKKQIQNIPKKKEKTIYFDREIKTASFEQKRSVCDLLIERIIVYPDASLKIIWNC